MAEIILTMAKVPSKAEWEGHFVLDCLEVINHEPGSCWKGLNARSLMSLKSIFSAPTTVTSILCKVTSEVGIIQVVVVVSANNVFEVENWHSVPEHAAGSVESPKTHSHDLY
jgi:hypothetical protein